VYLGAHAHPEQWSNFVSNKTLRQDKVMILKPNYGK